MTAADEWFVLKEQGNASLLGGDGTTAETLYLKALPLTPVTHRHAIHGNLALLYTRVNRLAYAMLHATSACSCSPTWAKGYLRVGEVFLAAGDGLKAEKALKRCKELDVDRSLKDVDALLVKAKRSFRDRIVVSALAAMLMLLVCLATGWKLSMRGSPSAFAGMLFLGTLVVSGGLVVHELVIRSKTDFSSIPTPWEDQEEEGGNNNNNNKTAGKQKKK
jgi:hypothetical protein